MDRYQRHLDLEIIGPAGQEKLKKATVAIVGLGALGTTVAELLARAGVNLVLIDYDVISLDNLQRQRLYAEADVKKKKAAVCKEKLALINSEISLKTFEKELTVETVSFLNEVDTIVDATDNMAARFLINDYCVKSGTPWVYGALSKTKGYVYAFTEGRPCFRCLFDDEVKDSNCDDGVLNSLVSIIGSLQVTETLKILLEDEPCSGLLYVDGFKPAITALAVQQKENCPACVQRNFEYLEHDELFVVKACPSDDSYEVSHFHELTLNFDTLANEFTVVTRTEDLVLIADRCEITAFRDGKLIFKHCGDRALINRLARKIYRHV